MDPTRISDSYVTSRHQSSCLASYEAHPPTCLLLTYLITYPNGISYACACAYAYAYCPYGSYANYSYEAKRIMVIQTSSPTML